MSVVEKLRDLSEVWKLFGDMPDETTLNAELTALFLGVSIKTLARYRQNGGGPPYVQYQSEDSKARNQRINYVLGDLRSWRDGYKVKNTMHAAQVRGLTFTSLSDFTELLPFWVVSKTENSRLTRQVITHVLNVNDDEFRELLSASDSEVIWISLEEAIFSDWTSAKERAIWHDIFIQHIEGLMSASCALQEKIVLKENMLSN